MSLQLYNFFKFVYFAVPLISLISDRVTLEIRGRSPSAPATFVRCKSVAGATVYFRTLTPVFARCACSEIRWNRRRAGTTLLRVSRRGGGHFGRRTYEEGKHNNNVRGACVWTLFGRFPPRLCAETGYPVSSSSGGGRVTPGMFVTKFSIGVVAATRQSHGSVRNRRLLAAVTVVVGARPRITAAAFRVPPSAGLPITEYSRNCRSLSKSFSLLHLDPLPLHLGCQCLLTCLKLFKSSWKTNYATAIK